MTTTTANTSKPQTDAVAQAAQQFNTATQTCCQGANDAFKAYAEANQKLFSAFTKAWGFDAFAATVNPFVPGTTNVAAGFDATVKAMNGLVDANARFATECNAVVIDAIRTNVRTFERTGAVMLNQFAAVANAPAGTKCTKPVVDAAREIFDETSTFMTKTAERTMKMNTEHVQNVAKVLDEAFTRTTAAVAGKTCCNA